jgi:Effector Associated Constant Component 1
MSTVEETVTLSFTDATPDEGNRYAKDLRDFLVDADPHLRVAQRRERDDAQDFGATLVLVLGTTAVSTLAGGIAVWLRRNSGARITLKNAKGELLAEGLDSKDAARIVEALSRSSNSL